MKGFIRTARCPIEGLTWPRFIWRLSWLTVQLVLVYCLAVESQPFFYQAF